MFRLLKIIVRKLIPLRIHVPLKYWHSKYKGYIEPEMVLLKKIIQLDDYVIDIGGNQGIYSYFISKFCRNIKIFEPNSQCYELLSTWASSYEGISVHRAALSNEEGSGSLLIPVDEFGIEHDSSAAIQNNNFDNTRIEKVYIKTLDSFNFNKVDFIKIDVEGHEFPLLQGSIETIKKNKPCLLIEIEQRHNSLEISKIFQYIEHLGYKSYFFDDQKLKNLSAFTVNTHQNISNLNSKRKYINNFLFFDREKLENGNYQNLSNFF